MTQVWGEGLGTTGIECGGGYYSCGVRKWIIQEEEGVPGVWESGVAGGSGLGG